MARRGGAHTPFRGLPGPADRHRPAGRAGLRACALRPGPRPPATPERGARRGRLRLRRGRRGLGTGGSGGRRGGGRELAPPCPAPRRPASAAMEVYIPSFRYEESDLERGYTVGARRGRAGPRQPGPRPPSPGGASPAVAARARESPRCPPLPRPRGSKPVRLPGKRRPSPARVRPLSPLPSPLPPGPGQGRGQANLGRGPGHSARSRPLRPGRLASRRLGVASKFRRIRSKESMLI